MWGGNYFIDALVVVEDALNVTDQFGQIMLTEFLHDISTLSNAKLVNKRDDVMHPGVRLTLGACETLFKEELSQISLVVEAFH